MTFDMPPDLPPDRDEYERWEREQDVDDLTDAIIEDTVHCDLCGASWVLGGSGDGLIVQSPIADLQRFIGLAQIKLCYECVLHICRCADQWLREEDECEHGVFIGDWCEPCNRAYKDARRENEENGS